MATESLECPHCKSEELRVLTETVVTRTVRDFTAYPTKTGGKLSVKGLIDPYDGEEVEHDDKLECCSCGHSFNIPEDVEVEYV